MVAIAIAIVAWAVIGYLLSKPSNKKFR